MNEEEFYRLTAEHVSDIVIILKEDLRIEFCAPSVEKLLGYFPYEVTGEGVRGFIHPEDWPAIEESFSQAARNRGRPQPTRCRVAGKDREWRTLESLGKAIVDEAGVLHFIVVCRDISDSVRTSEQMRKLTRAVEQSPAVIIITDCEGRIEYVNPKFTEVTGYTPEEVKDKNPRFLKSGHTSPEEYRKMWHMIRQGREYRGEFCNQKKNRQVYWASAVISGIRNEQGEVTHYLSVQEDVTEKKEMAKQLAQAQQLENIALLAGGMAHDLNNILAPILLAGDVLEPYCQDADLRRFLSTLTTSARRATDIVHQVLAFAKGTKKQETFTPIKHLARSRLEILRQVFPKSIVINANLPPELWSVALNPLHCEQIIMNLAINARDAMPEGGVLRISAQNTSSEDLPERFKPHDENRSYVKLTVADNGVGISEDIQQRIFEPLFTTKGPDKGTGLGLNIVKRILSECNGFIGLQSRLGEGSVFEVYLPAVHGSVEETQATLTPELSKGNRELILFVDDEIAIRQIAAKMLEDQGYQVLTAENGAEGLALLGRNYEEVKLLITDLLMPILSGSELIQRAKGLNPDLKVLALSGSHAVADPDRLTKLQADDLLAKPFTAREFFQVIQRLIPTSNVFASTA